MQKTCSWSEITSWHWFFGGLHIPGERHSASDESCEVLSEKLNTVQQQKVNQDTDKLPNIVNANQLKIMFTNSDGLLNKMQELKVLINSTDKPDVIAITQCKQKI